MDNKKAVDLIDRIAKDRDEKAFSEIFDYIAPKINAYYLKHKLKMSWPKNLHRKF